VTSGPNPVVSLQKDFTARATAISLMRRGRARTPPDREENISCERLRQLRDTYQRSRAQKRGGHQRPTQKSLQIRLRAMETVA